MSVEVLVKMFMIIIIGAGIGWITNYVAIKMLFRPYKEVNLIFFKIQGLIPKRKKELGTNIAKIIQNEILSIGDVVECLDKEKITAQLEKIVDRLLEEKLVGEITKSFPMLAMFLSSDMLDKIKGTIKNAILENKDEIIQIFSDYLEKNIDFEEIITKNIDAFSLEKLEEITYMIAEKEFKHIEIIGAILGGIIGFIQFLIGYYI